jgi:aspartyl protease family protein
MTSYRPGNKISQIMVSLAWISFLAMLVIGFDRYLEKRTNPNERPALAYTAEGAAEVVLVQNRQGHYIADGKINGHWVTFIIDTGATSLSIPGNVAKALNLTEGRAERTRTANGDIMVYSTRLDTVKLGSIELRNIAAHINPHMAGDQVLLGMSFLKHLELLQKDKQLTVRQSPR